MGSVFESIFVVFVVTGMFLALSRGWYSPEVVVFLSLLLVWNVGILSTEEALSGFNNPGMLIVGALFVVVASIENSRLAEKASRRVFGLTTSFAAGFARLLLCATAMSAFVNNTATLALFIPVTRDWARTRGFDPATILMPLAFACAFGGMLTTVGGGTNLVIQGLLQEAGKTDENVGPFWLFEPACVGLPLAVAGIGYLLIAAPRLLAAGSPDAEREGSASEARRRCSRDRSEDLLTEVEIKEGFADVGQPFAMVLATLGLPMDALLKVRRRRVSRGESGDSPFSPLTGCDLDCPEMGGGTGFDVEGDGDNDDDEESNGLGWTGRIGGSVVAAAATAVAGVASSKGRGGRGAGGPFALRRRSSYRRLGRQGSAEQCMPVSDATAGSCIEMATMRADDVTREVGTPATNAVTSNGSSRTSPDGAQDLVSFEDIYDAPPGALVRAGDVLVLGCDLESMVRAQGSVISRRSQYLSIFGVSTLTLPRQGSTFMELVLSRSSQFLGRTARVDNPYFPARYGCSVVAFRLKRSAGGDVDLDGCCGDLAAGGGGGGSKSGNAIDFETPIIRAVIPKVCGSGAADGDLAGGEDDKASQMSGYASPLVAGSPLLSAAPTPSLCSPVGDESPTTGSAPPGEPAVGGRRHRRRGDEFAAGDVVVVLATESFLEKASSTREFLSWRRVGRLPEPTGWFHWSPLVVCVAMLVWVTLSDISMVRGAFAACAVLVLGGWVDARQAVGHVNWGLLVLIGSALGFSKAVVNSGLADFAASGIRESGMSPSASVFALFGFTMFCTEFVSNNAAAAVNIPLALSMARELEVDYKPFAMTVLVAASCAFLTPIGTPTNTLVWAPGGYRFYDYAKLGTPLSLMFWAAGSTMIPWIFPF